MFFPRAKTNPSTRWTVFVALIFAAVAVNTANAQNLVTNPGFESGTNDWFAFDSSSFGINGGAHSGTACGSINLPNGFSRGFGQLITGKLQAGQSYIWSAWVRLSAAVPPPARTIRLNLYYTVASSNYLVGVTATTLSATWTQISGAFDFFPSGVASNVVIGFDGFSGGAPGFTFFVDEVSIVNSSPQLAIERANDSAIISWPATAAGYSLQSKANLSSPTWSAVATSLQTNAGVVSVTLSSTNGNRFFRLKK